MFNNIFDVAKFGAVADGSTLDTAAIQAAIEACTQAGGGTVYLGPGQYLSGTIRLKSNVRLYLEVGAELKGSTQIDDYEEIPRPNPERHTHPYWFLLYAENAQNISIEGRGTINGQGRAFWSDKMINDKVVGPLEKRPRSLIMFIDCQNLLFRDVTMRDSACYTVWLIGCAEVNIDGLNIINPYDGPNTDALDIDCCRNVRIVNCHIQAGDDCIAVKSDTKLLKDIRPCENIVAENCTFSSSACAIRLGYEGDAPIRNCSFNNITIYDTDIGIDVVSIIPAAAYCVIEEGTPIEDIIFSNIVMRNVRRPIFIWLGNDTQNELIGSVKNVLLSNIIAYAQNGSFIGGCAEKTIESVRLQNVKLTIEGNMDEPTPQRPNVWGRARTPYALWCSEVDDLALNDISIDWRSAQGQWQHQIYCEKVADLRMDGFDSRGFHTVSEQPSIRLSDVQQTFIRGSLAEKGTRTFLAVDGDTSESVTLLGNDLYHAQEAFVVEGNAEDVVWAQGNRLK